MSMAIHKNYGDDQDVYVGTASYGALQILGDEVGRTGIRSYRVSNQ